MNNESEEMELLGGIGIDLTEESKKRLSTIVEELISKKEYYHSTDPGYTYINGNVTAKGHLTVCYGVKNSDLYRQYAASNLKIDWQKSTKVKEIQVNLGYLGLYYVIVAIPEINDEIYKFNDWIRKNNEFMSDSPLFDPHIALCYIKNPGNYPADLYQKLKDRLIGKTVDFDSVNFYRGDDKVSSIKI